MDDYFFQQLPQPIILVQQDNIVKFNRRAKELWYKLEENQEAQWLWEIFPHAQGEVEQKGTAFRYRQLPHGQAKMLLLEEIQDKEDAKLRQLFHQYREHLTSLQALLDGQAQTRETREHRARLQQTLAKILRLTVNGEILLTDEVWDQEEPFDLANHLRLLCQRVEELLPDLNIELTVPVDLWVLGSKYLFDSAFLGLVANSYKVSKKLVVSLTALKQRAVVTVCDDNKKPLQRPLVDLLQGNPKENQLQAGFGLATAQKRLRAMDWDLWAEEEAKGGLTLYLSGAITKKIPEKVHSEPEKLDQTGSFSKFKLELSQVLPWEEYTEDKL